jgi:hypothetical protein
MLLAQCDDMVDALATDCSDQPFRDAVLPRRARCNELVADTLARNRRVTATP